MEAPYYNFNQTRRLSIEQKDFYQVDFVVVIISLTKMSDIA